MGGNGIECFCKRNIFCFVDLSKEKLCSILVFGNLRFNKVFWINHDNVASRGAVGRTHSIVILQPTIRRKDGSEIFGGFVYVCDGFPQRDFVLWVFMCPNIITLFWTLFLPLSCVYYVSLLQLPRQGLPRPIYIARAITPSPSHGYHACVFISRLPRHSSEFHFWVITPELSRSTTHVNRFITPAIVSRLYFTDHRLLRHPSSPPTPPPGRHTYQSTSHLTPRYCWYIVF